MNWYFLVLKKYAVFNGRARRKEYWFFQLFTAIAVIVLMILDAVLEQTGPDTSFIGILSGLYILGTFLPALGVLIRRLHDTNRSGWWWLLSFVPFGGIVLLVFVVQDGTPGDNNYGPDPKLPASAAPAPAASMSYAVPEVRPMTQAAGVAMSSQPPNQPVTAGAPAFCTHCGKPLEVGSSFCGACGRAL